MNYLVDFEYFDELELQREVTKNIPDWLYDVWDLSLEYSDNYEDLVFEVRYPLDGIKLVLSRGQEFNVDLSKTLGSLSKETKLKLIYAIIDEFRKGSENLEFLISWEREFQDSSIIMENLKNDISGFYPHLKIEIVNRIIAPPYILISEN